MSDMSDLNEYEKSLIEGAAKAANLRFSFDEHQIPHVVDCKVLQYWNPLHVDGDCFRLMNTLSISLKYTKIRAIAKLNGFKYRERIREDSLNAARYAVTRAAADMYFKNKGKESV